MRPDLVLDDDDKKKRFNKIQKSSSQVNNNDQNVISLLKGNDEVEIQIIRDHLPSNCFDSNISANLRTPMKDSRKLDDGVFSVLPSEHTSKSDNFIQDVGILDPETGLGLEITNEEKSNNLTVIKDQTGDEKVLKYAHKKFRKPTLEKSKYLDESCNIKKITIPKISDKSILTANLRAIR